VVKFFAGDVEPAFEDFKQSFSLDNSEQRKLRSRLYGLDTGILCKGFEARVLWFMGYPDQSLRGLQECLKLARDLNHPPTLAFMMAFVALAHQMRGEVAETLEIAEELVAFGKQHGFVLWIAEGSFFKGLVQTQRGQAHEGIETMRQGLVRYCATGTEMLRPYFHAVLAETLGKSKMPNDGIALILDALNFGKTYYDADLRRIQGQLVSMKPHSDAKTAERYNAQAKAHIAKAFQLARRQRAKSFELRAAIALQKFSKHNGDSAAASTTLREIYNFFSEGFSTADLREARKLLGVKTARQTR